MTSRILVVDDDRGVRAALRVNLTKAGYAIDEAESAEEALARLESTRAELVLSDVRMPGLGGLGLLDTLRAREGAPPVVLMTGFGSVESAVAAMKAGAADYLIKPVARDELLVVLQRVLRARALEVEVESLRAALSRESSRGGIIGTSPAMREVFRMVDAVAPTDALVLLTGPTGAGKEMVARAIHGRSRRAQRPFVAVNCAALPEGLLESELFGHERGAFTGAVRQHAGRFEQADGGTLLLDEIGEIPLSVQVRLLRVLESGELQRVGGRETLRVDARVIAATNRDLRAEVRAGRFREDLFYRLHVFHLLVPPLRDRAEDIPLLAQHFVERYAARHQRPARRLSEEVVRRLCAFDWPGNVRELEHAVERAVLLSTSAVVESVDLPSAGPAPVAAPPGPAGAPPRALVEALEAEERRLIIDALRAEKGVQARAADRLGLSRSNLNYRLKRLGITVEDVRYSAPDAGGRGDGQGST